MKSQSIAFSGRRFGLLLTIALFEIVPWNSSPTVGKRVPVANDSRKRQTSVASHCTATFGDSAFAPRSA